MVLPVPWGDTTVIRTSDGSISMLHVSRLVQYELGFRPLITGIIVAPLGWESKSLSLGATTLRTPFNYVRRYMRGIFQGKFWSLRLFYLWLAMWLLITG